jgi:hypothetical protein
MSPNEVSTANLPGLVNQHNMLTPAQEHLANDTSLYGIERDTIKTLKTIGASIIADRATWPKLWTSLTLLASRCFDRLNGLGTSSRSELSTQPKPGASLPIDTVVGSIGISNTLFPTDRSNPRSGFIKALLRLLQSSFVTIYVKLNANRSYECFIHKNDIAQRYKEVKEKCAVAPIFSSPWLMPGVSESGGLR